MSEIKPWYPSLETSEVFSEHVNPTLGRDPPLRIPLATEDTAPLQGSKDISDSDSLLDVIAAGFSPDGGAGEAESENPKE